MRSVNSNQFSREIRRLTQWQRIHGDYPVFDNMLSEHLLPVHVIELPTAKVPDLSTVKALDMEASDESSGDGEIIKKFNNIEFITMVMN